MLWAVRTICISHNVVFDTTVHLVLYIVLIERAYRAEAQ